MIDVAAGGAGILSGTIIGTAISDICLLKNKEKASEDFAKNVASQVEKDLGKEDRKELHDAKNGGPDRTKEEIKQDARDLYDRAGKPYPKIIR